MMMMMMMMMMTIIIIVTISDVRDPTYFVKKTLNFN